MQEVVTQLSENLVKIGNEVTVATSYDYKRETDMINGVRIVDFKISGNLVYGIKGELDKYQKFLRKSEFDIITNFAAQQWATDGMITILDEIAGKKVFVPTGFVALHYSKYKNYYQTMKQWMNKYDTNIFLSSNYRDIEFAKENNISKIIVIPNGASEDEFLQPSEINIRSLLGLNKECFLVLHVGSFTSIKGHREAVKIFRRARIRNACLLFILDNEAPLRKLMKLIPVELMKYYLNIIDRTFRRKRVVLRSFNRRQYTVSTFQQADLFLFPSNLECSPIVLFECMASKTPFLTTDVGNAKEIIKWSDGAGILLPTRKDESGQSHAVIEKSVRILEDCYNNPPKLKEMGARGFNKWRKRFTWERIAREYEKLYMSLLDKPDGIMGQQPVEVKKSFINPIVG